jgi:adenosylmethionine-8-amino-7-oxononanoate aminotransferase
MDRADIVRLDKRYVWHPYTPMDAWAGEDPIVVARARGAWLEDADGKRYLDGNASWYVAALGHGHPRLVRALKEQAETLAHCALAGIAHEPAARLAEELVAIAPVDRDAVDGSVNRRRLERVFFVDDGSTAIDAAVKMCVQARRQLGQPHKTRFVALEGAFHGDTVGATSLGGCEVFRRPYAGVTFDCVRAPFPEPGAYERAFAAVEAIVQNEAPSIAAVFVEPVVQGAAGMHIYDAAYLRALRRLCDERDVWLVADEVFSGYGRTGRMWACEHAGIAPDILCIGKAFAAIMPMGAVLASGDVFRAFGGGRERAFLHGHTFCGNPLGAALAREVLAIFREERILERALSHQARIAESFTRLASLPGVARVRSLGMIGAADLADPTAQRERAQTLTSPAAQRERAQTPTSYTSALGWRVYAEARQRGAYLRPLGNTVYVCPPLTIEPSELARLLDILEESVRVVTCAR